MRIYKLNHYNSPSSSPSLLPLKPPPPSSSSYGTSTKSEQELLKIVKENFDLRPGKIVKELDLKQPVYQRTSSYGHFGREGFTWETPKNLIF